MTCGIPCAKKVLDNCGILGAEARALELENFGSAFLAGEAAALYALLEHATEAFGDLGLYPEGDEADEIKAKLQTVIDESYRACEYAVELRNARDGLRAGLGFKLGGAAAKHDGPKGANDIARRCREVRLDIEAFFSKLVADELIEYGYKVPAS